MRFALRLTVITILTMMVLFFPLAHISKNLLPGKKLDHLAASATIKAQLRDSDAYLSSPDLFLSLAMGKLEAGYAGKSDENSVMLVLPYVHWWYPDYELFFERFSCFLQHRSGREIVWGLSKEYILEQDSVGETLRIQIPHFDALFDFQVEDLLYEYDKGIVVRGRMLKVMTRFEDEGNSLVFEAPHRAPLCAEPLRSG
jgi:hypothetical protein